MSVVMFGLLMSAIFTLAAIALCSQDGDDLTSA
jgi:hypothetical protein